MKYTIEVTEKQAMVIQKALEVYARLGMGQFRDALDCLPIDFSDKYGTWFETKQVIGRILRKHMKGNVDGWQSSLGIMSPDVSDYSRISWDIFQSIRNKIIRTTDVIDDHHVFKVSDEPLVEIKRVEGE